MADQRYVIAFTDNQADKKRFWHLYACFVQGGNQQERKGIETVRREIQILDKLDAISRLETPAGLPDGMDGMRVLQAGGGQLALTQPEYELLKKYLEAISPRTDRARDWIDLVDWFAALRPAEATKPPVP